MATPMTDEEFTELAHAAWPGLYRTAYLILGEHQLAIGQPNVPGQRRTTSGRIQADQHRAGQGRTGQREGELRQVVGQNADVERDSGPAKRGETGGIRGRAPDVLGPGPRGVLEP